MSKVSVLRNPHLDGSSFYWEAGTTGILLIHGFTATTTEVRLLADSLHKHGYTVAGLLLPGHGTTPQDCNRYTWQDWYSAVEQAYEQLATRCMRVVVGGESAGALLALHLSYQHPEASAILCYAPALRLKLSRMKVFLLTLCAPFLSSIPKLLPKDDNQWQGYAFYPLKGGYRLRLLQKATYPLLSQIHQPILIMQGRLDPTVHAQSPQIIYERVSSPVKELHWLERSTHCVILDKEHELAEELSLDFLRRTLN
ncbi:MAG TPA: alpha/beta fold hydrolase [Anaerolineales bacterium]